MTILKWTSLCLFTTTMTLMAGCTQSEPENTVAQNEPAATPSEPGATPSPGTEAGSAMNDQQASETVTARKVAQQAGETMDAAEELAEQRQDEYIRDLNEQLSELDEEMDELQQQASQLTDDARAEWQQAWGNLQEHREQMKVRIDELQAASGDAWQDLRRGTSTAWDELQQAFERANERFETDTDATVDEADSKTSPPEEDATVRDQTKSSG